MRPIPPDRPLCAAGTRVAHIAANGDVLACTIMPVAAGNIIDEPFRTVWEKSEFLHRLRAVRVADLRQCGSCGLLAACKRCHAQALLEDGDLLGPSSWACENARAIGRVREEVPGCTEA